MKLTLLGIAALMLGGCVASSGWDESYPAYPTAGLKNPGLAPGQNVSKSDGPCCDKRQVECKLGICEVK